jgi:organic radical activating enzyme
MLSVRETFATVQGEGTHTGMPAVFVRFAGCNLWDGLEEHREQGRGDCARWCDTEFRGGAKVTAEDLIAQVVLAATGWARPYVVLTGGEPMLQLRTDEGHRLLHGLRAAGVIIALETNGTISVPLDLFDHITVSPKPLRAGEGIEHIAQTTGHAIKVIVPTWFTEGELVSMGIGFADRFIQPRDGPGPSMNGLAISTAARLGWRVSWQTHKLVGLP